MTLPHQLSEFDVRIPQSFLIRVERFGKYGAFGVPCLLAIGKPVFDLSESFGYGMSLPARLVNVLAHALQIFAELLQAAAVDAADAFLNGVDSRVELADALFRPVDGLLRFPDLALHGRQPRAHFAGHARARPYGQRLAAMLAVRIDELVFASFADLLRVFAVTCLNVLQDGDAGHFVFHAAEVLAEPVIVVDGFAGERDGFRYVEHALFENVVEFRGCVRRLDFMQETAGVGAQSHVLPDGGVESRGVGMRGAFRIGFFEHGPGEWRVAVLVHEPWVDGSIPRDIPAAQAVLPVSGAQIEEFAAGKQASVGFVHVCVDDRSPNVLRNAVRIPATQEDRRFAVLTVAHADHATQIGVVVTFRTTGIRRLIVRGSGWVKQRDLRVDESGFA